MLHVQIAQNIHELHKIIEIPTLSDKLEIDRIKIYFLCMIYSSPRFQDESYIKLDLWGSEGHSRSYDLNLSFSIFTQIQTALRPYL